MSRFNRGEITERKNISQMDKAKLDSSDDFLWDLRFEEDDEDDESEDESNKDSTSISTKYFEYWIDQAVALGASRFTAEADMRGVFQFVNGLRSVW